MMSARAPASFAAALLVAAVSPAFAEDTAHTGCSAPLIGAVPREIVERPVPLRPGVGNAHDVVTTSSKEAQAFYDQGQNYLHGYVFIEAARSFTQALRHDPKLAMAHLGLSRAYAGLGAHSEEKEAVAKAQALADKATAREQRRIALRAKQLETTSATHAAYRKAIDDALAVDIGDVELWLIRGNAEEPFPAGRGQRGGVASTAFYRVALEVAPDNAAAHHYLTHSYEMIGQIDKALEHGAAYARLAPAIPHAHHMWGHDLRRVGRLDEAIAVFKKTDALEKAYYAAEDIPAEYDWHHLHNLDLLATAYQHKGSMRLAEAVMREIVGLPSKNPDASPRPELAQFLVERQRYEEALAAARVVGESKDSGDRAASHALAGQALLGLGRVEAARTELAAALAEPEADAVKRVVAPLRGALMLRSPEEAAEGRTLFEELCRTLRTTPGADAWIAAVFRMEWMARAARDAGDWDLADHLARQLLDHDPHYAGSHLAMALVAHQRGDKAAARASADTAVRLWRNGDLDLPERQVMETLRQP